MSTFVPLVQLETPLTTSCSSAMHGMVGRLKRVDVKCVARVSTAGDPRPAVARHPDDRAIGAGVQFAAQAVVGAEAANSRAPDPVAGR